MTKKNQNRFWFLFVMSILMFGISMVIWTVKQAMSVPVHESNDYMLKYQMADMNINEIMTLNARFKISYNIELKNVEEIELDEDDQNSNAKRALQKPIKLSKGTNSFQYFISKKDGTAVEDAKVTFLLTRPHNRTDDIKEENVSFKDAHYLTKALELSKEGRYTLALKVEVNGLVGYLETAAYLKN
jgi:nitrogen fixation protein FixH